MYAMVVINPVTIGLDSGILKKIRVKKEHDNMISPFLFFDWDINLIRFINI